MIDGVQMLLGGSLAVLCNWNVALAACALYVISHVQAVVYGILWSWEVGIQANLLTLAKLYVLLAHSRATQPSPHRKCVRPVGRQRSGTDAQRRPALYMTISSALLGSALTVLPRSSGPGTAPMQLPAVILGLGATVASARRAVRAAMLLMALLSIVNVVVGGWWSLASTYPVAYDVLFYKSCGTLCDENVMLHVTHAFAQGSREPCSSLSRISHIVEETQA
jgi:hypothetical protein